MNYENMGVCLTNFINYYTDLATFHFGETIFKNHNITRFYKNNFNIYTTYQNLNLEIDGLDIPK